MRCAEREPIRWRPLAVLLTGLDGKWCVAMRIDDSPGGESLQVTACSDNFGNHRDVWEGKAVVRGSGPLVGSLNVVLVGHSYGELVITSVVNEVPERIKHLVYLDAMVPEDGESAVDVVPMSQFLIDQAATTDTPWRIPPLPEMPAGLFGVTDPEDQAWLRTMLSDDAVGCFQQPVRLDNPATTRIPRTHIECTVGAPPDRRPVAPFQPNGDPAQVWELPTGHDCMITMPAELTELLLKLS